MVTALQAITTTGGYENTVKQVTRKFKQYDQVKEYPTICLVIANSPVRHLDSNSTFESDLGFSAIAYVKSGADIKDEGLLSRKIESMVGDMIKALYADYRLGYPADVDEIVIETVEDYYDWEKNIGVAVIAGHVLYRGTFTSP